jgi:hypothetical protein
VFKKVFYLDREDGAFDPFSRPIAERKLVQTSCEFVGGGKEDTVARSTEREAKC